MFSMGGIPTPREPGSHDNSIAPAAADRDQPYTWGRARLALRTSLDDWQWCRLLLLKGRIQDRLINKHAKDIDGL